jgi:hypothetical protein
MKLLYILFIILFTTTVSSCQNKTQNTTQKAIVKEKPECEALYNKYLENFSLQKKDSALYYIDKCIKCDTSQQDNKYIKVQLLISMKDYKNAILGLEELRSDIDDPTFKMQKGILMLKINDANSKKILEECYSEFNKMKEPTSSNLFYKIALDNYFKGKDYSLNQVKEFKQTYKDKPYENQNIEALQELINKETKEIVLFKLFNIND